MAQREYAYIMPFQERFVKPILGGHKTVTRRFTPRHVGTLISARVTNGKPRPVMWQEFARVRITDCQSVRLQDGFVGDPFEVQLEGLNPGGDADRWWISFKDLWDEIHAKHPLRRWDKNPAVWRIQFELVKAVGDNTKQERL